MLILDIRINYCLWAVLDVRRDFPFTARDDVEALPTLDRVAHCLTIVFPVD